MKPKRILSFLLVCVMILSILPTTIAVAAESQVTAVAEISGSGSIDHPYLIDSLADLEELATQVNEGKDFSGVYFKLTKDIDMSAKYGGGKGENGSNVSWKPIGNDRRPFRGSFDGNNLKITGLYINNRNGDYQGLFGATEGRAKIKDLSVSGIVIGSAFIGGLVGINRGGVVENCSFSGIVTAKSLVGGLVGDNRLDGRVQTSYNTSNIFADEGTIGGIVGTNAGTIENCYNKGSVEGGDVIGGVVGLNTTYDGTGVVKNCYNTGDVRGGAKAFYIGGVVGWNDSTIENCYNTGVVGGSGHIGGVMGTNNAGGVQNCYYLEGAVSSGGNGRGVSVLSLTEMGDQDKFSSWDFANTWEMGGEFVNVPLLRNNKEAVGSSSETPYAIYDLSGLEKLANEVAVGNDMSGKYFKLMRDIDMRDKYNVSRSWIPIGTNDNAFKGTFDGGNHKIIRLYIDTEEDYKGLFGRVGSGGEIKGLGVVDGFVAGKQFVGGLVGKNGGTIENCYYNGEVFGNDKVGGLIGFNENNGMMKNSYHTGEIVGGGEVGGLVGVNEGTSENSYYPSGCNVEGTTFTNEIGQINAGAFRDGAVAWLLQNGQENDLITGTIPRVWGQYLQNTAQSGEASNRDDFPVVTSLAEKQVHKVTFMTKSTTAKDPYAVKYVNHNLTLGANYPENPSSTIYTFIKWSQSGDTNGEAFDKNTTINGDMTVYAVGEENTAGTNVSDDTVRGTCGEPLDEVNLNDYVKNVSGAENDFDFELADKTLPEGLFLRNGKIIGTPTQVVTKTVDFIVRNNGISLMSYDPFENIITLEFVIVQRSLQASDFTFTAPGVRTYDGREKGVTVTSSKSGTGAVTVKYYDESGNTQLSSAPTNAGTYKVKIDVAEGDNYARATDLTNSDWTFTISPKAVTATIDDIAAQTYNGNAIEPTVKAYDGTTVIPASEYTVGYSDNINAGTATVTLTDNAGGNYTVSGSTTFTIKKLPVIIGWSDTTGWVYNGNSKTVTAEVSNTCGNDEVNLKFSDNSDSLTQSEKGTYTATVTAVDNDNYTIENGQNLTKEWSIAQANDNTITDLAIVAWTYSETANAPTATAKYGTPTFSYSTEENGTYTDTVPTNAGTYWVKATVAGTENYAEVSSAPVSFEIAQATPTENPEKKTTARVRRGRTLAEATVTEDEILGINDTVLEGTFAWVDDTKTMSADGTEQMTFTPNDTNYAPITIDVAVSTYSSGGGGTSRYTVKFDTDGGNTITSQTVKKNTAATEPTAPTKDGYIFDGWYTDSKFTTEYDFDTKVTKNITLYAKWIEDEVQEPSDDKKDDNNNPTPSEWKNPFTDVKETDWFFDNVRYANENGLMSGTTDTTFAPNDNLTRGMLVTVLYRAEGEPAVNKSIPFADVNASQYYANAVIWAEQNGIVKGVTETEFAPDENITREQIATIIYRYAEYKDIAPTGAWAIKLDYADVADISDYAVDGVMYCTMKNIMQGKDNNMFAPKDNATRAEIAAILNRFIESNK